MPASSSIAHPYADFINQLADAAASAIMPHFRQNLAVDSKEASDFDPVTIADKNGETAIRDLIQRHHPSHGILGEEHGLHNIEAENVWVLDPIDGTRAFISGLPTWGTLIGLKTNNVPSLGMMLQPYVGERFIGDTKKAWYSGPLGQHQVKTRECTSLDAATIFTTTPALFNARERAVFDRLEQKCKLSRYGTDCYAYCMVAAGHGDVVIESGLQPYDIVALVPIVEGAGGIVTTWTGGSPADGGQIIASGSPKLHDQVLAEINKATH